MRESERERESKSERHCVCVCERERERESKKMAHCHLAAEKTFVRKNETFEENKPLLMFSSWPEHLFKTSFEVALDKYLMALGSEILDR